MPDSVEQQLDQQQTNDQNDAQAEPEPKERHDGFIDLESHQKDVNVQHKKFKCEERDKIAAEQRSDSLQQELDDLKGKQAVVEISPLPDKYSDTYDADMVTRDEQIVAKAEQDAGTARQAEVRKEKDEARLTEEAAAIKENIAVFDANMVTHGLNPVAMKKAADTVIDYGISDTFQDILLEDPDGPLFVQYLADNPVELEEMNRMSTLQLVNHLNGDIRAKASLLKPQTSAAPDPPVTLKGGGAPELKEDWERGAKYE